jgi:ATPase, P-type (transporting), HAD superfamily, subfamily IC
MNGLTAHEVRTKTLDGQTNAFKVDSAKSTADIIKDNTFTLFNAINFIIAVCLIAVGSYSNALFIIFIINNIVTGIVVEIRAKKIIDKLTILNKNEVFVVRDGEIVKIDPDEIVLGDLLRLSTGDQVPADSVVRKGMVEANEALLTGESDLVEKKLGSELLSGSYVSSGQCFAEVKRVGADNYSVKLAIEAKMHKTIKSELLSALRTISRFTSKIVVPLGAILMAEALLMRNDSFKESVVSTSAALLGMLPKGMAVLIIIALITAVIKLGRRKVLVQEMYSIETMAHVDTLCLDKTGTITDGKMRVRRVDMLSDIFDRDQLVGVLGSYMKNSVDNSSTMRALRDYFDENGDYAVKHCTAFSSERKWSSMYLDGVGMVVLGAPEKIFSDELAGISRAQQKGYRVLGVGISNKKDISSKRGLSGVEPIAVIELEDSIRKDAKKTLKYLDKQEIDLKIISGDNPLTVSTVAKQAGFKKYNSYCDVSEMSDDDLKDVVATMSIFGRVSPKQKQFIVKELKTNGKTVAMTGDGVNDILALREADLSIAMAEGDAATKQISNIVLLESNFSDLPSVLFEGRRVVNNMFRVSSIFFVKTIYSFLLALLCALSATSGNAIAFPFIAIQITLFDQILEGYPSFFLSFEEDKSKIPSKFLKYSLLRALPNAILIVSNIVFIHFYGQASGWGEIEITTLMYYMLGSIMLFGVIQACLPLNKLRAFIMVTTIGGLGIAIVLFRSIVHVGLLTQNTLGVFTLLLSVSIVVRLAIVFCQKRISRKRLERIG